MTPGTTPAPEFVRTHCLFCAESADREIFPERLHKESFTPHTFSARRGMKAREHYRLVRCEKCGLVRSDPILSPESIEALYGESDFIFGEEMPYAAKTYAALFEALQTGNGKHREVESVVEIGASTGFFLRELRARNIENLLGFEPSELCVNQAAPEIRDSLVQDVYRPERLNGRTFDVACLFQVVDHLTEPDALLASLREALNPGGRLLIVCHDERALGARLLGDRCPIYDVEHIYLFSQKTLHRLVEQAGFRVLKAGALSNRYPLAYWLRIIPGAGVLTRVLPRALTRLPIRLRAGNQYLWAEKVEKPARETVSKS